MSGGDDCARAEEALLVGKGAPAEVAWAQRHQRLCPRCQARLAGLAVVSQAVLAVEPRLDDVQRARMGTAIEEGLRAPAPRRRPWWLIAPAAGLALAAAVLLALRPAPAPPLSVRPLPSAPEAAGELLDRLEVPAGTRIRARLGTSTRLTVVGPAQVKVQHPADREVVLALTGGTLLADYDHRAGGRLVIEAPGLVAEVVGTRLAVEAGPHDSRVSVSHGRVTVRPTRGGTVTVSDGQSWASDRPVLAALPVAVAVLLDEHGRAAGEEPPEASKPPPAPDRPAATARIPARRHATLELARRGTPGAGPEAEPGPAAAPGPAAVPGPGLEPAPTAAPTVALPQTAPPPQPVAAPALVRPSDLYRDAEVAMARGQSAVAEQRLGELVSRFPADPLADAARYELIQRRLAAGDREAAARGLEDFLGHGHEPALLEAARRLRCRLLAEKGQRCDSR